MSSYISNDFSPRMLPERRAVVVIEPIAASDVPIDARSLVSNRQLAELLSGALGRAIPADSRKVNLRPGDCLYVAKYSGPRISSKAGPDALNPPKRAKFRYYRVSLPDTLWAVYENSKGQQPSDLVGLCADEQEGGDLLTVLSAIADEDKECVMEPVELA